jgi:hypothetical protein
MTFFLILKEIKTLNVPLMTRVNYGRNHCELVNYFSIFHCC